MWPTEVPLTVIDSSGQMLARSSDISMNSSAKMHFTNLGGRATAELYRSGWCRPASTFSSSLFLLFAATSANRLRFVPPPNGVKDGRCGCLEISSMSPSLGLFSVMGNRVMRRVLQLLNPIVYYIAGACPYFNMYIYILCIVHIGSLI